MPRLYSSAEIAKVLEAAGYGFSRQKGSHQTWRRDGQQGDMARTVVVQANKQQIPRGTFKNILRQAGMTEEDFVKLLD